LRLTESSTAVYYSWIVTSHYFDLGNQSSTNFKISLIGKCELNYVHINSIWSFDQQYFELVTGMNLYVLYLKGYFWCE